MNKFLLVLIGILLGIIISSFLINPYFLPGENNKVIDFINSSTNSLDIVVYSLYPSKITDLILEKANNGIKVRIVVNKKRFDPNIAYELNSYPNIEVRVYKSTVHAKFYIVDGIKVMVGSNNISRSSLKKNVEADVQIIFLNVYKFKRRFEKIWKNSFQLH